MSARGRFLTLRDTVAPGLGRADVWLPPRHDPAASSALVVFLHGYGERGGDGEHLPVGLGPVLDEFPERFPGIVVLPQCPADRVWVSIDRPWAHGLPGAEEHVDAAVAVVRRSFWIDPARITLTGLSMGGFGTFVHGSRRTDVFRAFAPVCGGGQPGDAERIVTEGKPLFVAHGALDADATEAPITTKPENIQVIVAGGPGKHSCWMPTFGGDTRPVHRLLEF